LPLGEGHLEPIADEDGVQLVPAALEDPLLVLGHLVLEFLEPLLMRELAPSPESFENFTVNLHIFGKPVDHAKLNFAVVINVSEVIFVQV
jgi:hypothetical protein